MNDLLEQTLQLARPIEGPPERVEVQSAIESAVSTLRLDPRFEDVDMEVEAPPEPVEVLAYAQPLLQALTNLLLNAAQAQEGRGTIRVVLTTDPRRALVRIVDSGPGVPLEKRREIFRPFYTTKSEGTGLGLAEVRRAMEAAGGVVIVEDVRQGACFRLEIPLALTR
jgi:signal transduction histidine kinase